MYCIFDRTLYKQIDDVAIDLPLGLTLVNPLLVYHEQNWLERCPLEYKPFYYQMYAEDIFALFNSPEHLKCFERYLNSRHVNISSTVENKKDNRMSFINVCIIRKQDKFLSSVYSKQTFSVIYTYFDSFLTSDYKNWHDSYIGIYMFLNLLRLD